jgi:hypothetical protein
MTMYFPNPNVWAPSEAPRVMAVLTPSNETTLLRARYLELLTRRVGWLIEQWLLEETPTATQELLVATANAIDPLEITPSWDGEPVSWQRNWSRTLVQRLPTIQQALTAQAITFPVTVIKDRHEKQWLMGMFHVEDLQPNLAEWLGEMRLL